MVTKDPNSNNTQCIWPYPASAQPKKFEVQESGNIHRVVCVCVCLCLCVVCGGDCVYVFFVFVCMRVFACMFVCLCAFVRLCACVCIYV